MQQRSHLRQQRKKPDRNRSLMDDSDQHLVSQIVNPDGSVTERCLVLYSDGSGMLSTNGRQRHRIVGQALQDGYREGTGEDAMFDQIYGFVQTKKDYVYMVDRKNHCLRSLSLVTSKTKACTGSCKKSGYLDGTKPLFNEPHSIIKDVKHSKRYMVTDLKNNAVRYIMDGSTTASTYVKSSNLIKPRGMSQHPQTGDIYVITYHAITACGMLKRPPLEPET